MKTINRSLVAVSLVFLCATGQTLAQVTDPVVGTWELNLTKSTFSPGPAPKSETRIYTASGSDLKLAVKGVDGNGKPTSIQASYSLDGREHPITGSSDADSQSITRVDARTTEGTLKKGGKVVQTVRRTITQDGKTMTIAFKGVDGQGRTINNVMVFEKR
jgi:hypothetical protein